MSASSRAYTSRLPAVYPLGVALACAFTARSAAASECRATALLDGDSALVDSIDAALRGRGVATTATASCPAATARIQRSGTGVTVIVTDPHGRRSERSLATVDAAASLIESWARQDLNAAALVGFLDPTSPVGEARVDTAAPAPSSGRARDPLTLVVAGETSYGFDGTSWLGARATACARLGPLCTGAAARVLTNEARVSYDVLGIVDLPLALSQRFALVAGVGVGGGWFQSTRTQGEATTTITTTGVRADAHASLSIAVSRLLSLHVGISAGVSPGAPAVIDATADMPVTNGEPTGFLRGDIGLRIGVP